MSYVYLIYNYAYNLFKNRFITTNKLSYNFSNFYQYLICVSMDFIRKLLIEQYWKQPGNYMVLNLYHHRYSLINNNTMLRPIYVDNINK